MTDIRFKVGDRVRLASVDEGDAALGLRVGMVGTVLEHDAVPYVRFDDYAGGCHEFGAGAECVGQGQLTPTTVEAVAPKGHRVVMAGPVDEPAPREWTHGHGGEVQDYDGHYWIKPDREPVPGMSRVCVGGAHHFEVTGSAVGPFGAMRGKGTLRLRWERFKNAALRLFVRAVHPLG